MRLKLILLGSIILLLSSCGNRRVIIYEYNNVFITRADRGNRIYLYYGKYEDGNFPSDYVWAEYRGFNSGIQAYLTFEKNGKVRVRRVMGSFKVMGNEKNISLVNSGNVEFVPWYDNIDNKFNNTVEISNILKFEKERNLTNHSKVKANYPFE